MIQVGSIVHCKRIVEGGVRVGGAERYIVNYLSPYNVIVEARRRRDDSFITEVVYTRSDFDSDYELCPGG